MPAIALQQYSKEASAPPSLQPREFLPTGFEVIDPSQKVEEEQLPLYKRDEYCPMRIGEVLMDRYQILAKLGYGSTSTVWLARDLK